MATYEYTALKPSGVPNTFADGVSPIWLILVTERMSFSSVMRHTAGNSHSRSLLGFYSLSATMNTGANRRTMNSRCKASVTRIAPAAVK